MKVYLNNPEKSVQAAIIWMHGLGADAQNMMPIAEQLRINFPVRHLFMDAPVRPVTINNRMPMRAWYDILGLNAHAREDREGILASKQLIHQAIETQFALGLLPQQIFLAGFSQGGAMALFTGLHYPEPLGGIISLSAYLPLAAEYTQPNHFAMPVFIATGIYDQVVLPAWTKAAYEGLVAHGLQHVAWHEYPMEHCTCSEEMRDLSLWLNHQISHLEGVV